MRQVRLFVVCAAALVAALAVPGTSVTGDGTAHQTAHASGSPDRADQGPTAASTVIYLVRHAETQPNVENPPLSPAGEARAADLVRLLSQVPLDAVYTTDTRRTRQTVQALAAARGLELTLYDHRQLAALADTLRTRPGRYLISGHSNTTPPLVTLLGGDAGPPIDESWEYDRLYILVLPAGGGSVVTSLLRYGVPPVPR